MKHTFIIIVFFTFFIKSKGQDATFSQFFLFPNQLNPSFVGTTKGPNFNLIYRNQWPSINQAFVTYAVSYDQMFAGSNSAIGVLALVDDAGNGILQTQKAHFQYAYRLRIRDKYFIKGGLEVGVLSQQLNWNQLVFFDQLDPQFGATTPGGTPLPSAEIPPDNLSNAVFDLGVGLHLYTPNFYLGLGAKHLNTPNLAFYEDDQDVNEHLPVQFNLQAGYQFSLGSTYTRRNDYLFTPSLNIIRQGKYTQFLMNANFSTPSLFGGVGFRYTLNNPDAVIMNVGLRRGVLRIGYAYDLTISKLGINSGGAHELGIGIILQRDSKVDYEDCFGIYR